MVWGRVFCVVGSAMALVLGAIAAPADADVFAPDSYVEKPLTANAPLDPNSATMVETLANEVRTDLQKAPELRPNVDYQWCAPRIYTVSVAQPPVHVTLPDSASQALRDQLTWVPIPLHANTVPFETCADQPLVIWQPETNTVWELFAARKDALGKWHAWYGGKIGPEVLKPQMRGVSQNPGHWEDPPYGWHRHFGMSATSIPKLAGMPRVSEIQSGEIGHVVGIAMAKPAPCWRWPAQRMDGTINSTQNDPNAPPYGAILRLPASLNVDAMNVSRFTKAIAKAAQRHGLVIGDRGRTGFAVEPPPRIIGEPGHQNDPDPYTPYFDGLGGDQVVAEFPWEQLQVLAPKPGTNPCQTG